MTDIVERLRTAGVTEVDDDGLLHPGSELGVEAATEIATLRQQLAEANVDCKRANEMINAAVADYNEARTKAFEEAALVAERDVDWTRFLRRPKTDWKTGDEENVFSPPREPDDTMPADANVFAYKIGIGAGSVIAAAIRALAAGREG